jgi:hypothetical protein
MVSTRRFGRLGNELYQYAAVIGYAIKHGIEWSLPRKTNDYVWNPVHFQNLYNEKWEEGREDILLNENWNAEQHYQEIPFLEEKQIVLNGYWQSWKYWDFCRDEILKVFNFPYQKKEGLVSVHVRRGDYLLYPTKHPVITEDYLVSAIDNITSNTNRRWIFKFFSDDIDWCKWFGSRVFALSPESIDYSEGQNEIQDLTEMSCCEHQICSNSTMSVWAAELNQNIQKIIVVPSEDNWFGVDNKHMTVKDLFRPEWVQIKY